MMNGLFRTLPAILTASFMTATPLHAQPAHGIAMYGDPALPPDFAHLPYANPDAPTGGTIVTAETGSFDSLNPHSRVGRVPWQLRFLAYETLLGRSYDEPFTLYGLLAESVEVAGDGAWVEFHLNPAARFSDGSPVTVADAIWSFETLGTEGHSRYARAWANVAGIEQTGERSLRITFNEPNREMGMIMGLRPILKADQWEGVDFANSGMDILPIATAPYVITDYDTGRYVTLSRNPDYWGADIPFRRGTHNIDTIRLEFFGDATAMKEAFRTGLVSTIRETDAVAWDTEYDFDRMLSGEVVRSIIPHQRPSGMTGLVMNTRLPQFSDWRVRQAMIEAFNFNFVHETVNGATDARITSYFSNSELGMQSGPATGEVAELLAPFAQELLPGTLEGYALPEGVNRPTDRAALARAIALMEEAGYTINDQGQMVDASGAPFTFEILLQIGSDEVQSIINIYTEQLAALGITATVTTIDGAQFRERRDVFDFGMIWYRWGLSLSPGNEQFRYWGCDAADTDNSRNMMGACQEAIDAMIGVMLNAEDHDQFVASVRAMDRALMAGRYSIPIWSSTFSRLAHNAELRFPERLPVYGDWLGFQPDVWWIEE